MLNHLLVVLLASTFCLSAQAQESLPVRDADFVCVTEQKATQFTSDFQIDVASFGGRELCDGKVDTKKLFNDLTLLEQGRFANIPANNLIRGFIPADNYYNWMKSETRGIERGQDVPYATAYNQGGYFTMQNGWAQISTLGRVGTVVHEARHTEGYSHTQCTFGSYQGTGLSGCDTTYEYGGSHAIEMEYYARVSTGGVNFHPVYKKMARLMAMGRANFVFNASPLRTKETLMMLGASGKAYVLSAGQWVMRETPEGAANLRLKRTSFGATLFNGQRGFALDLYENSGFNWSVTDDFSYYKLLGDDHGMGTSPLQDLEEFDMGVKRYVFALNQGRIASFNFMNGKWNQLFQAPQGILQFSTVAPNGDAGLFLVDQQRRLFAVNPEKPSDIRPLNQTWGANIRSYARATGVLYRLDAAGVVTGVTANGEQALATPEPAAQLISVPLYDSFEVEP